MLRYCLISIFLAFLHSNLLGQIVINEFSASNFDSHQDNYGEYEDWIELYNTSNSDVDLNGWYLTDKPNNLTKWQFPSSFIVSANSVAIIYCSGLDEINGGVAHSNFKITQTKFNEVFVLSDASGSVVDSISVVPAQKSHSRGREINGGSTWSLFTTATPNANNTGAMLEYAPIPSFSQTSGYYSGPFDLTLSSTDPNALIYYTTDGSRPDNTANLYTGPFNISSTSVIKAVAYSTNVSVPPSFIDYHTFFINDTHTIPILSVSGDSVAILIEDGLQTIGSWWNGVPHEPQGTIEWFDKNGVLLDKGTGEFNKHGNDSWAYDQRGFDYVMRDQFGYNHALQDKVFDTKSRDKFQRVIVKAAANDNYPFSFGSSGAHIRDAYIQHLSQLADLRLDERSTKSCILYLNGQYWGVYEMREKVDDHDFTDYYYDQDKNNLQFLKTWGGTWIEYGGPQAQTDWDNLKNFITTNSMANQANYQTVKSQYNTGSIIDYFLLNSYVVCGDWLNWNTAWWRGMDTAGEKKKWRYTLWDMDNTFDHGTNYTGVPTMSVNADPCDPSSLSDPGGQGHVPIWNELLNNSDFFDDYLNRWQDLANGYLSCDTMISILDSMIAVIDPEMPRQIAKWGGTYTEWQSNVQDVRDFINARCSIMNAGFGPCYPALSGPHNITVQILGIGEVEMSDGNIINQTNTGWTDQRYGGVNLPFEVKSGTFQNWEVLPAGTYVYDPLVDTLVLDLQGDVTVIANFIPPVETRDVTFKINPSGTSSDISVDGNILGANPTTVNYVLGDTVNVSPIIDPLYGFSSWSSDSCFIMPQNTSENISFYANHDDTITLNLYLLPTITAFISGNDTICSNRQSPANVSVAFTGIAPYTFSYSINGVAQQQITTMDNPYIISTREEGVYDLLSFSDAVEQGNLSGQGFVTISNAPVADFQLNPNETSILYTTIEMIDKSSASVISWDWDFGDNIGYSLAQNPKYTYPESVAQYQISLRVADANGCADSTYRILSITDDHWIYIPNSFSPNSDAINDLFYISYHGIRESSFTINIYNRSNEVVYSTKNIFDLSIDNGWDGTHQSKGFELPFGTYVYEVSYQDTEGWKYFKQGGINIIR
ncbi:MAG: CotH kinase family protein [Flavobacteriales bacterium]